MLSSLALQNVLRSRTRSLITLAAILAGCAGIVLAGGFFQDSVNQMRDAYIEGFLGHVVIAKAGYFEDGAARPFDFLISDSDGLLDRVRRYPEVERAAPRIEFSGLLASGDSTMPFIAHGLSPRDEPPSNVTILSGRNLESENAYEVVIGTGLARTLGVSTGGSAAILTNTAGGALNGADVSIDGVFLSASKEYDDRALRLPLKTAQKILRTDKVQTITLYLHRISDTDEVVRRLRQELAVRDKTLEVRPWQELPGADFVVKVERFYSHIFLIFELIICTVVILSIFNTMNMSVIERIGEIGTLMALGTERRTVVSLFLVEGALLGIIGGAVGLVVGFGLGKAISAFGIPMPTAPGTNHPWIARIAAEPKLFVIAFLMALATALVSSLYPALKASKLEIAEALRHNV